MTTTYTKLQQAVITQLGSEGDELTSNLQDVCNHGADTGWHGFTYHSETCAFFAANQAEIVSLVKEMADDLGETPMDMVASFQCLKDYAGDREIMDEIGRAIYGKPTDDDVTVPNALAWFALEEVARQIANN
jgi:hypothetical protein